MSTPISPTDDLPVAGSGAMFDGIAHRYDLLNRVISLGVDQGWRRKTVRALQATDGQTTPGHPLYLDLATGTADLALLIARTYPACRVLGIDPSEQMMNVGRGKIARKGFASRIELQRGDAQALELADASVDGITMAFGIRNVPDRAAALREMARVTKPGAAVAILELSEPKTGLLSAGARFHMHRVVPLVGGLISGSREYRYLPQSIAAFPAPEEFCQMMTDAGLTEVRAHALTFGVCHLYIGVAT